MNYERRKEIAGIMDALEQLREHIEGVMKEERENMGDMPKSLKYNSPRWDAAAIAVGGLGVAKSEIEKAIECLESAKEGE